MNRPILFVLGVLATSLVAAVPVTAVDGKAAWTKSCAGCHAVMAPKTGDKAAWEPLISKGAAELMAAVVKGKGAMPPMGGAASDAEVAVAVEYIISQMQ